MKSFIYDNPTFIDDLHRAGLTLLDMEFTTGPKLLKYYHDLQQLDEKTGTRKVHNGAIAYRLECCESRSYFKKWQDALHGFAQNFEGQLFTEDSIENFRQRLNAEGVKFRNFEEIRPVDWEFVDHYTNRPALAIGYGCQLTFTPVFGWYLMEEVSHE